MLVAKYLLRAAQHAAAQPQTVRLTRGHMNTPMDKLWCEACDVLRWHSKNTDSCIQTLNRLWQKSPWVSSRRALPELVEGQVQLIEEHWNLDRLVTLLHERQQSMSTPHSVTPPIIVVRSDGIDYLIDGRTRINYWARCQTKGPHRTLVIEAAQSEGA